jgi:ketosteroid isomerase-like protein
MNDRSDTASSLAAVLAAAIIGLLLLGGGGYFIFYRGVVASRQAAMEAARARAMAEQAMQAERQARDAMTKTSATLPRENAAAQVDLSPEERGQITAVLDEQAKHWNAGDLDRFMDYYWKSDDLTFSSGGKITRGWQATLDRYRARYPTTEEMGSLSFDKIEAFPLADGAALVLGEWKLARDADPVGGNFSLVLRRIDGRWLIVHDHTSALREEP